MKKKRDPFMEGGDKAWNMLDTTLDEWLALMREKHPNAPGYELLFAFEMALLQHAARLHLFEARAMTPRKGSEAGFQELAVDIFREIKGLQK